ncbi:DNA polymerase [Parasphingorhabdus sp.]|uniref:DNA polymerase n=1 Tax=Parasphingorhabdus sp. TaxID=2709688 RepID=UPI003A8F75B8
MSRYLFDCETDGLLDELTTVHSLVLKDADTSEVFSYRNDGHPDNLKRMGEGVQKLMEAEEIIGHNIIKFDVPAIQKVFPWFTPKGRPLDTLVLARLFWPEIKMTDSALVKKGKLPKKLQNKYSLEAFGYRLGLWKGDYAEEMKAKGLDPWASWNPEMQDYCEQDVEVTHALYRKALPIWAGTDKKGHGIPHSDKAVWMEMEVATILSRQERWGFTFDAKSAEKFYVELIGERETLDRELRKTFGSWNASGGTVDVKRTRRVKRKDLPAVGWERYKNGNIKVDKEGNPVPLYVTELYEEGSRYCKVKTVEFNPKSGHHIADRLKKLFGWEPQEFTPSGEVKVDETILSQLPWPEAKLLTKYLTVAKRISQLAEGKQAWLKKERNGRIHGAVVTAGAVTRRMTHNFPNVAQVPKVGSPYGAECRSLFTASPGFVLVGCDADALELRCLGGYMSRYDGGAYIETILSGDKAQGTDMHSVNCRALGMDPKGKYVVDGKELSGRDIAKTWFYAFIYGAGDFKLGRTVGTTGSAKTIIAAGKKSRDDFLKGLPALGKLVQKVQERAFGYRSKKTRKWVPGRGFLVGLDGGKLKVRHKHAALNTLLQSAGAIIMKQALVILDRDLQAEGLAPGVDYEFCANVHDEWQLDVLPMHVEFVMKTAEDAIRKAGEELEFGCPLAGNADQGTNWRDTH